MERDEIRRDVAVGLACADIQYRGEPADYTMWARQMVDTAGRAADAILAALTPPAAAAKWAPKVGDVVRESNGATCVVVSVPTQKYASAWESGGLDTTADVFAIDLGAGPYGSARIGTVVCRTFSDLKYLRPSTDVERAVAMDGVA